MNDFWYFGPNLFRLGRKKRRLKQFILSETSKGGMWIARDPEYGVMCFPKKPVKLDYGWRCLPETGRYRRHSGINWEKWHPEITCDSEPLYIKSMTLETLSLIIL